MLFNALIFLHCLLLACSLIILRLRFDILFLISILIRRKLLFATARRFRALFLSLSRLWLLTFTCLYFSFLVRHWWILLNRYHSIKPIGIMNVTIWPEMVRTIGIDFHILLLLIVLFLSLLAFLVFTLCSATIFLSNLLCAFFLFRSTLSSWLLSIFLLLLWVLFLFAWNLAFLRICGSLFLFFLLFRFCFLLFRRSSYSLSLLWFNLCHSSRPTGIMNRSIWFEMILISISVSRLLLLISSLSLWLSVISALSNIFALLLRILLIGSWLVLFLVSSIAPSLGFLLFFLVIGALIFATFWGCLTAISLLTRLGALCWSCRGLNRSFVLWLAILYLVLRVILAAVLSWLVLRSCAFVLLIAPLLLLLWLWRVLVSAQLLSLAIALTFTLALALLILTLALTLVSAAGVSVAIPVTGTTVLLGVVVVLWSLHVIQLRFALS